MVQQGPGGLIWRIWLAVVARKWSQLQACSALPVWHPPVASPMSPAIPFKTAPVPCRDAPLPLLPIEPP